DPAAQDHPRGIRRRRARRAPQRHVLARGRHEDPRMRPAVSTVLLAEVIRALSYALDLTEGEPPGHATRSCVIGMRLAEELDLNAATRSDLFYALLLKDAGCTANAARMAALFGADDHELKHSAKRSDWSAQFSAFLWWARRVAPGQGMRARLDRLLAIKNEGEVTRSL